MSLVGHWEEAKFPAGINLVQTMAPDCVRGGSGLDYNTCGIRIGWRSCWRPRLVARRAGGEVDHALLRVVRACGRCSDLKVLSAVQMISKQRVWRRCLFMRMRVFGNLARFLQVRLGRTVDGGRL